MGIQSILNGQIEGGVDQLVLYFVCFPFTCPLIVDKKFLSKSGTCFISQNFLVNSEALKIHINILLDIL